MQFAYRLFLVFMARFYPVARIYCPFINGIRLRILAIILDTSLGCMSEVEVTLFQGTPMPV